MEEKQNKDKPSIQAEDNSIAVGGISIDGDVSGSIAIGHQQNTYITDIKSVEGLPPEPGDPPYMGLHYFSEENADLFFGREALTQELVDRLESTHFLAIVGASGSGKSSLVRAGVVPALRKQGSLVCVITPTSTPLESLAKGLSNTAGSLDIEQIKKDISTNLEGFYLEVDRLIRENHARQFLLVVDQFEELFTGYPPEEERKMFIENLMNASSRKGRIRVVIALRADFYARCAGYQSLREALAHRQEFVGPMSPAELRRAILEPARRAGWQFQEGLVDLLLDDVGDEPGRLPLLAHALRETWEQRRGRVMTLAGYAEAGRVDAAIATTAETVLARFEEKEKAIARRIFLSLTELGETAEHTRRRATRVELISESKDVIQIDQVLQKLTEKRLITAGEEIIEVAHEALIREWPTLQDWIKESQSALRVQRQLTRAATEWKTHNFDRSYLYQGARLALALEQAKKQDLELDSLARDFLGASEQAARRSRVFTIASLVTVTTIVTVVFTLAVLALTGQLNRLIYRPLPIKYVQIEAGEFRMGSTEDELVFAQSLPNDLPAMAVYRLDNEQKPHNVYLDTYEISRYETTNEQYYQCVRADVCTPPGNDKYANVAFDNFPVTDVNWEQARRFCEWNNGALLPTEAQWEKAARAAPNQESRIYPWGNDLPDENPPANVVGLDKGGSTMPVGSFPDGDSAYGVSDMAGNVWEWVRDWYAKDYYQNPDSSLPNPQGPKSGDTGLGATHTIRGGSFDNDWVQARSSYRSNKFRPGDTAPDLGFRCVIE